MRGKMRMENTVREREKEIRRMCVYMCVCQMESTDLKIIESD